MKEQHIKQLGILCSFLVTAVSGWIFDTDDTRVMGIRLFTVMAGSILQWETAHWIIKKGRTKYPHLKQVKQRVRFTAFFFFILSISLALLGDFFLDQIIDGRPFYFNWMRLVQLTAGALFFTLTTIGLFEAVYYYSNYNRSEIEKEELLRTNLQSQFDSLKGQVNPHFLFNSLNSLSSLISKDPQRAEKFVEDLSTVYRYLLKSNERELNTLQEEVNFIQSYLYLLTTRFGENLKVTIHIAAVYEAYLLPPLTLQLLVENAVKHNIISSEEPLHLSIYTTEDDRLHVVNNLQRKTREVLSEKVGLSNIMTKYELLRQPPIEVKETGNAFIVIIPLINATTYESIHY